MPIMRVNAFLMVLLFAVLAAPVVDAIACDDCRDLVPVRDQQRATIPDGAGHTEGDPTSSGARGPAQQETDTAQDLCPVCANTGAVIDAASAGAPALTRRAHQLPKLIAFSDPTYSITKPPQN
jgi:hypothetical protein